MTDERRLQIIEEIVRDLFQREVDLFSGCDKLAAESLASAARGIDELDADKEDAGR